MYTCLHIIFNLYLSCTTATSARTVWTDGTRTNGFANSPSTRQVAQFEACVMLYHQTPCSSCCLGARIIGCSR